MIPSVTYRLSWLSFTGFSSGKSEQRGNYFNNKLENGALVGYGYGYDQLNRIREMRRYDIAPNETNWSNSVVSGNYNETIEYDANGNILTYLRNGSNGPMDDMKYVYADKKNQLVQVTDPNNATRTYEYDAIGNLKKEGINAIDWTVYGIIRDISKTDGTIQYGYDPAGNRITKIAGSSGTYYVRDAQGNVLAVYTKDGAGALKLAEQHLYGSSRLGLISRDLSVPTVGWNTYIGHDSYITGTKFFELTNHLGNVLATISDKKIGIPSTTDATLVDHYSAHVKTAQDYYPFGMIMREESTGSAAEYRYGFNGKENDNDVKGTGNQQDYGMRIYDPRIGKFLSVDPITKDYPDLTPYQFASNTPIWAIDMDGLEGLISTGIGTGHIVSPENARKIANRVGKIHQQGIKNVEAAQQAKEQAIKQGRADGINWLTLGAVYIAPWWNRTAPWSDANDGAVLLHGKNLDNSDASLGDYTAAGIGLFVPFVSGSTLKKAGSALIEGTISVFKNGKELQEAAYKIGKYGHKGTKEYNSVLNAIKSGGNIVASSEEEALKFLKEAMPGIGDETGKQASKFGYRIDNFVDEAKDGLKQGHQGRHINYYDKENKVRGTILIEDSNK